MNKQELAKTKKTTVYVRNYARALKKMGHEILGTTINPKNPRLKAYVFQDTPELQQDLQQVIKRYSRAMHSHHNTR